MTVKYFILKKNHKQEAYNSIPLLAFYFWQNHASIKNIKLNHIQQV